MPRLRDTYPYYLAGRAETPNQDLAVLDKHTRDVATRVPLAGPEAIEEAIAAAVGAAESLAAMPSHARESLSSRSRAS